VLTVDERDTIAGRFEASRAHLRAVAYRMLGSRNDAEDAVQEAWLRLSRSDSGAIDNLEGWLTAVVARVSLDMLRSRRSRREVPLDVHVPDPVISREDPVDPEQQALIAESVGLALLIVLETLGPEERLAFVLHDMFGVPFDEIATIAGRSRDAAYQLASRARRRVRGAPAARDSDLGRQRKVVNAYLTAARDGDFDALLMVLDPDVVLRADTGATGPGPSRVLLGARAVADGAATFAGLARLARPVLVNGAPGFIVIRDGHALAVIGFTVTEERIVEIDILADPARLGELDLAILVE
jgi:RNA polymerase sigma-70 factor, ECF subfamily